MFGCWIDYSLLPTRFPWELPLTHMSVLLWEWEREREGGKEREVVGCNNKPFNFIHHSSLSLSLSYTHFLSLALTHSLSFSPSFCFASCMSSLCPLILYMSSFSLSQVVMREHIVRFLLETEHSYILSLRTLSKVMKWREREREGERENLVYMYMYG